MALAVCLLFDRRTEQRMFALWQALEELGVPTLLTHTHGRHLPHLSYVVMRTFEVESVRRAVAQLPGGEPLTLHFDAVGWFRRGRAALVPAVSGELVARQERVVEAVSSTGAELHHHYEPGRWIPHCSLATRVRRGQAGTLAATAYDVLPVEAVADRAAVIDSSTGERWLTKLV